MDDGVRTGDFYFHSGPTLSKSQAIQSKLFQSPVKRNFPQRVRMYQVEDNSDVLKRRKITAQEWENLGKGCTTLYFIILIVLSLALPIAYFLSGETSISAETWEWHSPSTYLWVFNIFIYVVALFFLLLLHLYMNYEKRLARKFYTNHNEELNTSHSTEKSDKRTEEISTISDSPDKTWQKNQNTSTSSNDSSSTTNASDKTKREVYAYGAPGVNFFLRAGAIGFAFGSIMLDGFRIGRFIEDDSALDCFGPLYLTQIILRIILIFFETLFMTKNHRIVLNFRRGWLSFGFGHLIATNLSIWAMAVIIEAYEGFHSSKLTDGESEHNENSSLSSTSSETRPARQLLSEDEHHTPGKCEDSDEVLVDTLAPYLYPLVIEFSLIAAAILYKILSNVGKLKKIEYGSWEMEDDDSDHQAFRLRFQAECHKANTGVFLGLLVLVVNLMVTIVYLSTSDEDVREKMYLIGDVCMQLLATVTVIMAFYQTTKLDFSEHNENKIDNILLIVTVSGLYFLTFSSFPPYMFFGGEIKWLWVWILADVSNFVQSTIQMLFILDGGHREATTSAQKHNKQGRSLISFLLFSNLAMWVINSFEMKEALVVESKLDFYGSIAWTIMLYVSLPLSVFFRFHSVVCLSDIWVEAYSGKRKPKKITNGREGDWNGNESSIYHNVQLQNMHDRLQTAENRVSQRIAHISNTHGDNTI